MQYRSIAALRAALARLERRQHAYRFAHDCIDTPLDSSVAALLALLTARLVEAERAA